MNALILVGPDNLALRVYAPINHREELLEHLAGVDVARPLQSGLAGGVLHMQPGFVHTEGITHWHAMYEILDAPIWISMTPRTRRSR